jgi:hypothetical protein
MFNIYVRYLRENILIEISSKQVSMKEDFRVMQLKHPVLKKIILPIVYLYNYIWLETNQL